MNAPRIAAHYRRTGLRCAILLLVALLPLAGACGGGARGTGRAEDAASPRIGLADLPAGLGRGYPVASVEGVDNDGAGTAPGSRAPNFLLTLDDGRTLTMEDLRGHPVLINHWATWCGPCRLEMPEIVAAAQAHPDLVVLAVNMMEARSQIEPFAAEFGLELPVVVDPEGTLRDLYGVRGLPTTILVDRDGTIATVWAGVLTAAKLQEMLEGR